MSAGTKPSATESIERLLRDAGVGEGMRVLDIGCGPGVVTRLLARLVGEQGSVVGLDREARLLARAADKAASEGLHNVTFLEHDLADPLPASAPFDAIVARRVLMYLPDPVAAVSAAVQSLRPGGIVVFQEIDGTVTPARTTPHPLHDQVNDWIWSTIAAEGANVRMGFELPGLLAACGLNLEHIRAEAEIEGYPGFMVQIVRAILPRILEHTDATEASVDIDTLDRRLEAERLHARSVYLRNLSFGTWARKP